MKTPTTLLLAALLILAGAGCSTFDRIAYDQEIVTATNWVNQPVMSNGVVAGFEQVPVTTYATNLVVKPGVARAIETGGDLIPIPGGDTAAAALGLVLAGVASWRNNRNKKTSKRITDTLIENINGVREVVKAADPDLEQRIMSQVEKQQVRNGTVSEIRQMVKA